MVLRALRFWEAEKALAKVWCMMEINWKLLD